MRPSTAVKGSKKLLGYGSNMHPRNIFSPTTCTSKSSPRDRAAWMPTISPQLDNYPDTEIMQMYTKQAHMDEDEAGVGRASRTADTAGNTAAGAAGPTQQPKQHQAATKGKSAKNYAHDTWRHLAAPTRRSFGMPSDEATSPERRAQRVPIDPHKSRLRQNHTKF